MSSKAFAYLVAVISALCGNLASFGFIPEGFIQIAGGVCALLVSAGIVSASHSSAETPLNAKAGVAMLLLIFGPVIFLACSQAQIKKAEAVIVTIEQDTKKVVITGCKAQPEIKVAASLIVGLYPVAGGPVVIAEQAADMFCAKALALAAIEKGPPQ